MPAEDEAEAFRSLGHQVVDLLADELVRARARRGPVLASHDVEAVLERWPAPTAGHALAPLIEAAVAEGIHLHHPGYVGHQVAVPAPEAALAELVGTLTNNAMGVFEMGPVGTVLEHRVVRWMVERLGLPAGADGVLTSGGSLGNLTALLAARAAATTAGGVTGPLAVLVGEGAHYSIARAARAMGLGDDGLVSVPSDERHRLRADALPAALAEARRRGRTPFAVVGSACSTATGAFDPLPAIAEFAAAHGLHFHVDGAHGAALALSPRLRARVAGIERADTVVWDAHKLLRVPSLCTAVLYRDARVGAGAFAQQATYLFSEDTRWDLALRTFECTKRLMPLGLYLVLSGRGEAALVDYVEGRVDLAARFAERVAAAPDLELALPPECNIVCFRPRGVPNAGIDAVRAAVVRSGRFYLVATTLGTERYLRVSLMNPDTTLDDLDDLLAAVRTAAAEVA